MVRFFQFDICILGFCSVLCSFFSLFWPYFNTHIHRHEKSNTTDFFAPFLLTGYVHWLAIVDRADFCFSCEPFCLVFQINHTYFRSFVFFIRCVHMHTTNTIIMDVNRIGPNSTLIHSNRKLFRTNREKKQEPTISPIQLFRVGCEWVFWKSDCGDMSHNLSNVVYLFDRGAENTDDKLQLIHFWTNWTTL